MESGALFATSFVVALSGAMAPGPLLTATIAESIKRGFRAGPLIILGHAILELALLMALLGGLAAYLTRADVTRVIEVMGGIFLLFMGFTMLRDALGGRTSLDALQSETKSKMRMHPVLLGITISLATPFWILWWATVGLSYIGLAMKSGLVGLAYFYSGHVMADLSWYSLVALAVTGGRRFITPGTYNLIMATCSIFLLGLGLYFIYTGWH